MRWYQHPQQRAFSPIRLLSIASDYLRRAWLFAAQGDKARAWTFASDARVLQRLAQQKSGTLADVVPYLPTQRLDLRGVKPSEINALAKRMSAGQPVEIACKEIMVNEPAVRKLSIANTPTLLMPAVRDTSGTLKAVEITEQSAGACELLRDSVANIFRAGMTAHQLRFGCTPTRIYCSSWIAGFAQYSGDCSEFVALLKVDTALRDGELRLES